MRNGDQRCQPWTVYPPMQRLCPPEKCQCDGCRQRCGPGGGRGYLLPRVIACGREWLRRQPVALQVEGLPAGGDMRLREVRAAGDATWTQRMDHGRRMLCLHVTIPLLCQAEDACGCMHCGRAQVEMDTALRLPMDAAACWREQLLLLPCVRLVCAPCPGRGDCFDTQMEILLESYLVRWEMGVTGEKSECCPPPLPLYPPPCRME